LSRNKDRMGMAPTRPETSGPPPQIANGIEGFSFVVPTEFVDLPSRGKFYSESHPLHGQDSVEIKQMTAKEEDILVNRSYLRNGSAIERVLQSVIVDKRINASTLLVGDRNAILIAMRITGYGNDYETKVSCPSCGTSQKYEFDLFETNLEHGEAAEELGVTDNGDGTFDCLLPKSGVTATFKLLTGADEKQLLQKIGGGKKMKAASSIITSQLGSMITAVNGDSSKKAIEYVICNMPSMDSRHLRLMYRLTAPNVDLTQDFACDNCDHEQEVEVPLGADFFWPDR